MTADEWMKIGVNSGAISIVQEKPCIFLVAYQKWFLMKMSKIRPQSLDRIEVTFNKYYAHNSIVDDDIFLMDTTYVSSWINKVLVLHGSVTHKEFGRIYQIISNVLVYALEIDLGNARLINWEVVKRYLPDKCILETNYKQFAVPPDVISLLYKNIVMDAIYSTKQSASLCLLLNFSLGLRVGELATLNWSDIDFDNKIVRVFKTESKCFERDFEGHRVAMMYLVKNEVKTLYSVREVPLCKDALSILHLLKKHHKKMGYVNEYLCFDGIVDGILVRSLDRCLRRLCKLCSVPYFSTHMIRKTFVSRLHYVGVPTRVIADIIGHADIKTTEKHYVLSFEDKFSELRETFDMALKY